MSRNNIRRAPARFDAWGHFLQIQDNPDPTTGRCLVLDIDIKPSKLQPKANGIDAVVNWALKIYTRDGTYTTPNAQRILALLTEDTELITVELLTNAGCRFKPKN